MSIDKFDPSLIDSILLDVQGKENKIIENEKKDNVIDEVINDLPISEEDVEEIGEINKLNDCKADKQINLNNIQQNIAALSNQLSEDKNDMVSGRYGEQVDYNKIYEELNMLIKYSKEILETLAAIEPDVADPKQIQATASLINSIKGLVSEFSTIHKMNIKHQYNIELENIKQQHRLSTIEYKQEIRNTQQTIASDNNGNNTIIDASIPWSSDLALEFMEFMKQRGKNI